MTFFAHLPPRASVQLLPPLPLPMASNRHSLRTFDVPGPASTMCHPSLPLRAPPVVLSQPTTASAPSHAPPVILSEPTPAYPPSHAPRYQGVQPVVVSIPKFLAASFMPYLSTLWPPYICSPSTRLKSPGLHVKFQIVRILLQWCCAASFPSPERQPDCNREKGQPLLLFVSSLLAFVILQASFPHMTACRASRWWFTGGRGARGREIPLPWCSEWGRTRHAIPISSQLVR
jgi:hypothetical protein